MHNMSIDILCLCEQFANLTIYDIQPYNTYKCSYRHHYRNRYRNRYRHHYTYTYNYINQEADNDADAEADTDSDTNSDTDSDNAINYEYSSDTLNNTNYLSSQYDNIDYKYTYTTYIEKLIYDVFTIKKPKLMMPLPQTNAINTYSKQMDIMNSMDSTDSTNSMDLHEDVSKYNEYNELITSNIYFNNKDFIYTKLSINLLLVNKPDRFKHYNYYYSLFINRNTPTDNITPPDNTDSYESLCSCIGICIGMCIDASDASDASDTSNTNAPRNLNSYLHYIKKHNIIINFTDNSQDIKHIYAKILYIFQYVKYYYNARDIVFPVNKVLHMPPDLFLLIDIIIDNVKNIIINIIKPGLHANLYTSTTNDNDICNDNNISYYKQFNTIYYNYNESIRINTQNTINNIQLYDNEILYGLQLILCHLKLLTNYYKNINIYKFANMSNTHISSIFRLLHNMCIITIYFNNNIF